MISETVAVPGAVRRSAGTVAVTCVGKVVGVTGNKVVIVPNCQATFDGGGLKLAPLIVSTILALPGAADVGTSGCAMVSSGVDWATAEGSESRKHAASKVVRPSLHGSDRD